MSLAAYRLATRALGPAVEFYLKRRAARGKEDPARIGERHGRASADRPPGRLVWLHAASVGEAVSVLPLIARLHAPPRRHVLLTTGTVTSASLMAQRLPAGALHQYVPLDRPDAVGRFLDHWRPDLAIWVESELWPNLITEARRRGLPTALVNARLSPRSARRWRRAPGSIRQLLAGFDRVLAQSEADAARLRGLGAREAICLGNLKQAGDALPADPDALAQLRAATAGRPLWLAASSHAGEERIVLAAHAALAADRPNLLTIIVPRHPERGGEIASLTADRGLAGARRATGDPISGQTQVYIADTLGELGLFYRLADIVLIGGTFGDRGGHNPLEPARLDCALIAGPDMRNFAEIAAALTAAGALETIADASGLANAVADGLARPTAVAARALAARRIAEDGDGVTARLLEALMPLLPDAGA